MSASLCIAVFLGLALETSSSPTESRQCRPGYFHNVTTDLCQGCPSGTYTNSYNLNSNCDRCSICTGLHKLASACTASTDAVCRCPDGYYEHEDGCSPKPGTYAESRLPDTPEWTWPQPLLITTSVVVALLFGFAIAVIVRCPELRKKLLCCQRNSSADHDQPTTEQQLASLLTWKTQMSSDVLQFQEKLDSLSPATNHLTTTLGSKPPHKPPNGTAGSAASTPDNTTTLPGNEGSVAASGSTVDQLSTSVSGVATGGAADAGAHDRTPGASAQPAEQAHSDNDRTPKKSDRLSPKGDAKDMHELVDLPPKARSDELQTPDGNEGNSPQCGMGGCHQGGCAKCRETNGPSITGTLDRVEDRQISSVEVDAASRDDANESQPLL